MPMLMTPARSLMVHASVPSAMGAVSRMAEAKSWRIRSRNPLFRNSFLISATAGVQPEPLPQVAKHIPYVRGSYQHDNKPL